MNMPQLHLELRHIPFKAVLFNKTANTGKASKISGQSFGCGHFKGSANICQIIFFTLGYVNRHD